MLDPVDKGKMKLAKSYFRIATFIYAFGGLSLDLLASDIQLTPQPGVGEPQMIAPSWPPLKMVPPRPFRNSDGTPSHITPMVTHSHFSVGDKTYSVYVVHPVHVVNGEPFEAFLRIPGLSALSSPHFESFGLAEHLRSLSGAYDYGVPKAPTGTSFWSSNSAQARELLGLAFQFALQRYEAEGIYLPETGEKIRQDVGSILSGKNGVVVIADKNQPESIHQIVSVVVDEPGKLLPFEERLIGRGLEPIKRRPPHRAILPEFTLLNDGPTGVMNDWTDKMFWWYNLRLRRYWNAGAAAEIKALIRNPALTSPDFVPLALHMVVANGLVRNSHIPVPFELQSLIPSEFLLAQHHYGSRPFEMPNDVGGRSFAIANDMPFVLEPNAAPTLRVTDVYVDSPSKVHTRAYINTAKFNPKAVATFPDPDIPGKTASILHTKAADFEEKTYKSIRARHQGGALVERGVLIPVALDIRGKPTDFPVIITTPGRASILQALRRLHPRLIQLLEYAHAVETVGFDGLKDWELCRSRLKQYLERFE